jgi:Domain of Unknown Function (DUF928)
MCINLLHPLTILTCATSWILTNLISTTIQVASANILVQSPKPKQTSNRKPNSGEKVQIAQPPPGQGAPPSKPAQGRPGCPGEMLPQPLTALVPESTIVTQPNNQKSQLPWGKSTQEHPTFWFYVPYSTSIHSSRFLLKNKTGKLIYQASLPITGTPGIIRVAIPPDTTPLENGKWYEASLIVNIRCSSRTRLDNYLTAWVLREELSAPLKEQLNKQTTPLQQAIFYAENGLWYDALAKIAELKQQNLDDGGWQSLLDSAALGGIADKQIVSCCTPRTKQ